LFLYRFIEMESQDKVIVPFTPDEVTSDLLSNILGFKVDPTTLAIAPNSYEGKGFLSNLLRVVCTKLGSTQKINLIVKLMPQDPVFRDILVSMEFDKAEILGYQKVIPALIAQVPEFGNYVCPFIFGKFTESERGYGSFLVLEDLKPLDYFTLDFGEDLTQFQIEEGINFLVKLHFAGGLVEEAEGKPLSQLFPFLLPGGDGITKISECCKSGMPEGFPQVFQLLSNSSSQVREAYTSLQSTIGDIIVNVFQMAAEFPSLIHADLWTNNILFNNDRMRHTKVIDWQIISYRDATVDLAIFLISSLSTREITIENVPSFVQKYYNLYQKTCLEKNVSHLVRRNWVEFLQYFNTVGLSFATIWLISSVFSFIGKNDERLIRIFEFFYEAGVISWMANLKK